MRSFSAPRWRWSARRLPSGIVYDVADAAMLVLIAGASVGLFWTLVRPLGPVGNWQAKGSTLAVADPTILTRFDPFFRAAAATGPAAVTSLPMKLFGIRIDQAMGRGSAIIAGADNIQTSYAVGEEIAPGVILKSVAFDSVTIERGGAVEQLFLDQSVQAGAPPVAGAPAALPGVAAPLSNLVAFAPRIVNGATTGFTVTPKGAPDQFAATGLKSGDVVTQVNGSAIRSLDDATAALAGGGGQATLTVERNGQTITVATGLPK